MASHDEPSGNHTDISIQAIAILRVVQSQGRPHGTSKSYSFSILSCSCLKLFAHLSGLVIHRRRSLGMYRSATIPWTICFHLLLAAQKAVSISRAESAALAISTWQQSPTPHSDNTLHATSQHTRMVCTHGTYAWYVRAVRMHGTYARYVREVRTMVRSHGTYGRYVHVEYVAARLLSLSLSTECVQTTSSLGIRSASHSSASGSMDSSVMSSPTESKARASALHAPSLPVGFLSTAALSCRAPAGGGTPGGARAGGTWPILATAPLTRLTIDQ